MRSTRLVLAALLALAALSTIAGAGEGDAAASPAPADPQAAFTFIESLDELYKGGLPPEEIVARGAEAGISREALQPFLDFIGPARAITEDYPPAGAELDQQSADALAQVLLRFDPSPQALVIGGLTLTAGPYAQRQVLKLRNDLAELLPQGDLSAPPAPTGDALFDAYAAAVDARIRQSTEGQSDEDEMMISLLESAALPDSELASWEPQFGSDPRYWELRYLSASESGAYMGGTAEDAATPPAVEYLQEARQRGIARPATLMLLFIDHWSERGREIQSQNMLNRASDEQPKNYAFSFDDYESGLLGELRTAAPEQAWPLYLLALDRYFRGDEAAAGRLLREASGKVDKVFPRCFPFDVIDAAPDPPNPPGGAAFCGAVGLQFRQFDLSYGFKDLGNALLDQCVLSGDWSAYQASDDFAFDQALQSSLFPMPQFFVPLSLCSLPRESVMAEGAAFTDEQRRAMQRRAAALELAKLLYRVQFTRYSSSIDTAPLLAPALRARGLYVGLYLERLTSLRAESAARTYIAAAAQSRLPLLPAAPELAAYPQFIPPTKSPARSLAQSLGIYISTRAAALLGE